jgi:sigma-54 specific flagellar transcriptional regulator A
LREIAQREVRTSTPSTPPAAMDLNGHMSAIEMGLIRKAMADADGTVAEAARMLGLRRTTLVERLRKYRLQA